MSDVRGSYAFPHGHKDERRRLELLQQRLDPITIRRVERLGLAPGARCLEVGGGQGSITRWLCDQVGAGGRVTATDLDTGFLSELSLPNLEVLRHDVRTDDFPLGSFDFVHERAVLMHIGERMATLRRMVSWLAPGGWLLLEDCDFGMWAGDYDPLWAAHPAAQHEAFPSGSLSRGRAMLRQIHTLGLEAIGADGELDIIHPGTPLSEFYRLSMAATAPSLIDAGILTPKEAAALIERVEQPDFLACGFVHMAAWGRRADIPAHVSREGRGSSGRSVDRLRCSGASR
jgi:SAM-dependent methyltransferase